MTCEICGRSACTRSFHSLKAQEDFDKRSDAQIEHTKETDFETFWMPLPEMPDA